MAWKTFGAAVLISGAFALPAAAGTNLVTNGSFETGTLSGWTLSGTAADGYPADVIVYNLAAAYPNGAFGEAVPPNNAPTNSPDPAGSYAAYFVSDFAANETLSQSVYLTPGVYQIGFSAYLPQNGYNNAGDATFSGSIAGVTLANFAASSQAPTSWQTYDGSTTINAAGFYDVDFVFNTDLFPSKDVVIDQVYIVAGNPPLLPEPASMAMLGAGLVAFGLTRRRRRA